MTNHFTIAVSKRLREMGVEGETEFYWKYTNGTLEKYSGISIETELLSGKQPIFKTLGTWQTIPAYTFYDVIRLMPKIGETLELGDVGATYSYVWEETMSIEPDAEEKCVFESHKENRQPHEVYSHALLDAFLEGDYPPCEKKLLELLETK